MNPEPHWTELARRFEAGEIEVEYQYKTSLKNEPWNRQQPHFDWCPYYRSYREKPKPTRPQLTDIYNMAGHPARFIELTPSVLAALKEKGIEV